jgi:hypothetical protein
MNAHEAARALGRHGGLKRAERLTSERKSKIASLGGKARARSFAIAKRLRENFDYVAAILELSGPLRTTDRLKSCHERLPGIYRQKNEEA